MDTIYAETGRHWSDARTGLSTRTRNCLYNFFRTEAELRAAWPIKPGDFPNLGYRTIQELSAAFGLPLPERITTPALPNPKLLRAFSDGQLLRELADRLAPTRPRKIVMLQWPV
jgi:hypothetical protein